MANEQGKGIFVWVRSSNPSAADFQDFADANGICLYEKIAESVNTLAMEPSRLGQSGYSNVGMVLAGLSGEKAAEFRRKYENIWFLVPGYGAQGATAEDCVKLLRPDGTGSLVNSSRGIIYAYERPKYKEQFGDDWKKCIEQAVIDAKLEISSAMQKMI